MSDFSFNPLKTITVTGKLSETVFSENICIRNCDIGVGNWTLSLSDITFAYPDNFKLSTSLIFDINCNLVQNYCFNESKIVTLKNVSLVKFVIESEPKVLVNFLPQRWFTINNPSEIIILTLSPWPIKKDINKDDKKLLKDSTICFTVLFKRIN